MFPLVISRFILVLALLCSWAEAASPVDNAADAPTAENEMVAGGDEGDGKPDPGMKDIKTPDAASKIAEIVMTKSYVEFSELDPLPRGVIGWDKNSGKYLYISKEETPFIFLFGKLKAGHELSFNDKWVPVTKDGRFEFKVSLPLEPSVFAIKIFSPNRKFHMYRLIYSWSKFPPTIRYRVKEEEDQVIEKSWGYSGKYSRSGWAQLYAGNNPTPVVDLDAQRQAQLYFRIYNPPEPEDFYDAWSLTIRNSLNEKVGYVKRYGAPPTYLDWRELNPKVFAQDTYTYQLDLFGGGGNIFEGKPNRFDTTEGHALLEHQYVPGFQFEPQGEIGYFSFSNLRGIAYSGISVGGDLPFVFENRFLARLHLSLSLHNLSETNTLNYSRIGLGYRFGGVGQSPTWGQPYFFRVDVYVNFTNFTVHPVVGVVRYTHPSLLIEPHLLLWNYHYIVPFIEYGSRFRLEEQRLSFGLTYYFYIRPWALKFGLGFSYDKVFVHPDPEVRFTLFRTMTQLLFTF